MNTRCSGIFRPAALTRLSGLSIVVATTIVLGRITQDQSGHAAAAFCGSFRAEMQASDSNFQLITTDQPCVPKSVVPSLPLPGELVLNFGEMKETADPAQEFSALRTELERVAGYCRRRVPFREVRIDLPDADSAYVSSLLKEAAGKLDAADLTLPGESLSVEIQTWAALPTSSAWIDALREASRLRGEVDRYLSLAGVSQFKTTSSAALWPYPDSKRPEITIVWRVPVDTSTDPIHGHAEPAAARRPLMNSVFIR